MTISVKKQSYNVDIFLIPDERNEALITLNKLISNNRNPQNFDEITMNFIELTAPNHLAIMLATLFLT